MAKPLDGRCDGCMVLQSLLICCTLQGVDGLDTRTSLSCPQVEADAAGD